MHSMWQGLFSNWMSSGNYDNATLGLRNKPDLVLNNEILKLQAITDLMKILPYNLNIIIFLHYNFNHYNATLGLKNKPDLGLNNKY